MTRQILAPLHITDRSSDPDDLRRRINHAVTKMNIAYDAVQATRARPEDYSSRIAYSQAMTEHADRLNLVHAVARELEAIEQTIEQGQPTAEIVE